jgi:hypothetical protein
MGAAGQDTKQAVGSVCNGSDACGLAVCNAGKRAGVVKAIAVIVCRS